MPTRMGVVQLHHTLYSLSKKAGGHEAPEAIIQLLVLCAPGPRAGAVHSWSALVLASEAITVSGSRAIGQVKAIGRGPIFLVFWSWQGWRWDSCGVRGIIQWSGG